MLAYFAKRLPRIVKKMDKKKTLSGPENFLEVLRNARLVRTVHQKGSTFSQQIWPLPSYHYKGAFDFAVIIQSRLLGKERDKLTKSSLGLPILKCMAASPPKTRAKTIPLATRAKFCHVVYLSFLFFRCVPFNIPTLHLRRFKCFF